MTVQLYKGFELFAEAATGANGDYEIKWTADETGLFSFYARQPTFYVQSDTIVVEVLEPVAEKVAEMDVYGIRAPFATDEEIMSTIVNVCNITLVEKGQPGFEAKNPRLKREVWAFWKCTVDIVGTPTTLGKTMEIQPYPSPIILGAAFWIALVILFMGTIIGYLIGKWWTYRTEVRPLEEALQEVVQDVDEIISSVDEALAEGLIDEDFAAELKTRLQEARDKAEEAGKDPHYDWVDFLAKFIEWGKYIPWVVGGIVTVTALSTVAAYAPRRRD